ncbi:MAG: hypothetical protein H6982_14675 [Chromatiales bacterium]|nr:hypothetical protein [Chromatiales bacterium]
MLARALLVVAGLAASATARAGDVEILAAELRRASGDGWSIEVTLRHADTGWEHYADAWRVVTADGTVLGTRTLYHPHVDEQPFTRGLGGVVVAPGVEAIWIEAHDKVHGWSAQRLRIDLRGAGDRMRVTR